MSDTPSNHSPSAEELMLGLQEFMQRCEGLLDRNIEPDLIGMDRQVEILHNSIADLKFDELVKIQPSLQGLMDQLLNLENRLKAERDNVRNSLQTTSQKKQALGAYQRMQSSVTEVPKTAPAKDGEDEA